MGRFSESAAKDARTSGRVGEGFAVPLSQIPATLAKISALRQRIAARGLAVEIEIDGGVKADNIGRIAAAGADVFVAGSAVFSTPDYGQTIALLRRNAVAGDGR